MPISSLPLRGGTIATLPDEEYRESLFGRELFRFRYAAVGLAHLWAEEYVGTGLLGVALAELMSRAKHGDRLLDAADRQLRVAKSGLDDARKHLLLDVMETYSRLSKAERARLARLISRKEYRTLQEVKQTWSDKMRAEAKRETLLRLLATRFGPLSAETIAKVNAVSSADELDAYAQHVVSAASLEEVGL